MRLNDKCRAFNGTGINFINSSKILHFCDFCTFFTRWFKTCWNKYGLTGCKPYRKHAARPPCAIKSLFFSFRVLQSSEYNVHWQHFVDKIRISYLISYQEDLVVWVVRKQTMTKTNHCLIRDVSWLFSFWFQIDFDCEFTGHKVQNSSWAPSLVIISHISIKKWIEKIAHAQKFSQLVIENEITDLSKPINDIQTTWTCFVSRKLMGPYQVKLAQKLLINFIII